MEAYTVYSGFLPMETFSPKAEVGGCWGRGGGGGSSGKQTLRVWES